jgi:hypothetical protein
VGPWASLDRWGKSRPPPGFDPRTFQPVTSRYTDRATEPADDSFKVTFMMTDTKFGIIIVIIIIIVPFVS